MYENLFIGAGRLTSDVELKHTQNGSTSYAFFTVAIERPKTEGKESETDFINVKVWRGKAEWLSNNIGKGTPVWFKGPFRIDRWTDQNGQKRERCYIDANDVQVQSYKDVIRPANYVEPSQRQNSGYQQPVPQGYGPAQGQYQQGAYPQQPAQGSYQQNYAQQYPQGGYQQNAPAQSQYQQPPQNNGYQQNYAPAPQQPAQGQYQQGQYAQNAPAPAQNQYAQSPQAPGPGYTPGEEFTPIIDDDLPF